MLSSSACKAALCFCWGLLIALPTSLSAQTNYYGANGSEYAIVGSLGGDQAHADVASGPSSGIVVWQDNATDGSGWGISARRIDSTLSGILSPFRVNATGTNDQQNPRVALLKNGGAAFVWQGGKSGVQHIYGRFLNATNTFLTTTDVVVSVTNKSQMRPALAVLNNSNVVVVWSSLNQVSSNSMYDVYGQILSSTGSKIGTNFLINQFTTYNQRTPAIVALKNGGFAVVWVSEQQRAIGTETGGTVLTGDAVRPSVDIYGRLFASNGVATSSEFLINNDNNPCADPAIALAADGTYSVVWTAKDIFNLTNGWDIYARSFSNSTPISAVAELNTYHYGDQFSPRIAALGNEFMAIWTSLVQDGSREGVFGRFLHSNGSPVGNELAINTTTAGQQLQPAVASDGSSQFLAVWSSFTGLAYGFDLNAQRYLNVDALLPAMDPPFVYAPFTLSNGVYQPQLQVSWPRMVGISISNYEVYVDGSPTPMGVTTSNSWTMTKAMGLNTNSTHSFAVDYTTMDGRRAPLSDPTSATTWSGVNWGGVPFEWMAAYFGSDASKWPAASADSDGDGASNATEFFAGTNPMDAASVLRQQVIQTSEGIFLSWNTQPGFTYQVQVTTDWKVWTNFGSPRLAAGTTDSVNVGSGPAGYYRIELLR